MTCLAVWAPMRPLISAESIGSPLCVPRQLARLAVDRDDDVFQLAVVLLGGRDEGRLDRLKDDLLVDVLLAVERIDDAQHVSGIHGQALGRGAGKSGIGIMQSRDQWSRVIFRVQGSGFRVRVQGSGGRGSCRAVCQFKISVHGQSRLPCWRQTSECGWGRAGFRPWLLVWAMCLCDWIEVGQ